MSGLLGENHYQTHSEEDTFDFARDFALNLKGGEIILLSGELGAGKTVFVRGIADRLGIKESITSPTFTLMNCYEGTTLKLCHIDAYRLKSGEEAFATGITEYFGQSGVVCCIEWWQNIRSAIAGKTVKVEIEYLGEEERKISINEQ